jgi:hypothetical protein
VIRNKVLKIVEVTPMVRKAGDEKAEHVCG